MGCLILGIASVASASEQWLHLYLPADNPTQQGFARFSNVSDEPGMVTITGIDDDGVLSEGFITAEIIPGQTISFNSQDLENGNESKGLVGSFVDGQGNWRLKFESDVDLDIVGMFRNVDGFVNDLHDTAPSSNNIKHDVLFMNPGTNENQKSRIRLINLSNDENQFTIVGYDDEGAFGDGYIISFGACTGLTRIDR